MLKPLNANNKKIVGLPLPTNNQEAANKAYVDNVGSAFDAKLSSHFNLATDKLELLKSLDANGNAITGIMSPSNPSDAASKEYVDTYVDTSTATVYAGLYSNFTFETDKIKTLKKVDFQGKIVSGVPDPTSATDAVNKRYVDKARPLETYIYAKFDTRDTGSLVKLLQPVNMNNKIISNLGTPDSDDDAATKGYVDSKLVSGSSLSVEGDVLKVTKRIDMRSNRITGLADPTYASDAVTKDYVDTRYIDAILPII